MPSAMTDRKIRLLDRDEIAEGFMQLIDFDLGHRALLNHETW